MPSLESLLVQPITSGGVNAASAVTSLGQATTIGNTLLIFACTYGTVGITTPTNYTLDTPTPTGNAKVYAFRKSNIAASETLPTLSTSGTTQKTIWFVLEVSGLELVSPKDINSAVATATAQTISQPSASGTFFDTIGFSLFLAQDPSSTTPPTWSNYSNPWAEIAERGASDATTSIGAALASYAPLAMAALPGCTATASPGGNVPLAAVGVKYAVAGAATNSDLRFFTGFEFGTTAGIATGVSPYRLFETVSGSPTITTATPRTGNYCLELPNTAVAHNLTWPTVTITSGARPPVRVCFRFVGGLPTADTELCLLEPVGAVLPVTVRYRTASQKISVQIGTNTEQLSVATVAADTWYAIDMEYDVGIVGSQNHIVRWQLDGVEQTPASHTSATTGITGLVLRLGRTVAAAPGVPIRMDDCMIGGRRGNYPLGDHRVILLKPDPAGTITVGGSAANLGVFSANGTVTAWNAATALTNISEGPPPTIGATAAGLCQVTADFNTNVIIPMETYNAGIGYRIRAVRILVCGWAASATAKTFGLWAKTNEAGGPTQLFVPYGDPLFDNSTTTPAWVCALYTPSGGWNQANLDILDVRPLGSDDATPDVGVHWVAAEVAIQTVRIDPVFGGLDDDLRVEAPTDPVTGGILALHAYAPLGQGNWTLIYEINGVEQTPVSVPAGSSPVEVTLEAADMPTISRITMRPA